MTAFDTTTNTASASFTDSWGTIVLQPSGTDQYVRGFQRSNSKRYFEFLVNSTGGDGSKLWIGFRDYFGVGGQGYGFSPTGLRVWFHETATVPSTTASALAFSYTAGDTLMFAANFSGDGNNAVGTSVVTGSYTDGFGNRMLPVIWDFGKNGTWVGGLASWDWPAHGFPKHGKPMLLRDATSASAASVTLRVATNSFVHTLPTNYIPWGDGPEGSSSLSGSNDATVNWDDTKKSDGMSLSGSFLFAVELGNSGGSPKYDFVYSTELPMTGKRYIEFTGQQTDSLTNSNWGNKEWCIGLADGNIASITASYTAATGLIVTMAPTTSTYKRGVDFTGSITNGNGWNTGTTTPTVGMMVDFDNLVMWVVNPYAPGATAKTPWRGDKTAASAFGYSFGATSHADGIPFTISAGTVRVSAFLRKDYFHAPTQIYLKMNPSGPFESYPLLPGATSMNGNREVLPHAGDYWDVANNAGSMTYGAADLVVQSRASPAIAQGRHLFNSGKRYFEIYKESDGGGATTFDYAIGVRLDSATTMTAATAAALMDTGMFFWASGTGTARQARYNVTLSWSATESVTSGGTGMNRWYGVAVDFDAGKLWCGAWNKIQHVMEWGAGNDPATGVGAHMTFTASTTLRIAVLYGGAGAVNDRTVLVADSNNLIGLPSGFTPWDPPAGSVTATPSGTTTRTGTGTGSGSGSGSGSAHGGTGGRVIWPYGVQT